MKPNGQPYQINLFEAADHPIDSDTKNIKFNCFYIAFNLALFNS